MALKEFLQQLNNARQQDFVPLCIKNHPFGYVLRRSVPLLYELGFPLKNKNVLLQWQCPATVEERSQQLAEINGQLRRQGLIGGWRDELLPVYGERDEIIALTERASASFWGIRAYGVHLNGWRGDKLCFGRRSATKTVAPNCLDQLAAGAVAAGLGPWETLLKEGREEANLPEELTRQAKAVGLISYCQATENGVRRDTIFNFDMELPPDFVPHNGDGEMSEFIWLSAAEAWQRWAEFKLNSLAVLLDYRLRQGHFSVEEADFQWYCQQRSGQGWH